MLLLLQLLQPFIKNNLNILIENISLIEKGATGCYRLLHPGEIDRYSHLDTEYPGVKVTSCNSITKKVISIPQVLTTFTDFSRLEMSEQVIKKEQK
jgi:hypothetical protein